MARSKLTNPTDDLMSDSGAVLWSFVLGEQLEFPVNLDFIQSPTTSYGYEAVVVEADNQPEQTDKPTGIKVSGVQTRLNVRVPIYRGNWDAAQAYNTEDVISFLGTYYKKVREATEAVIDATLPNISPKWVEIVHNRIYLQFPKNLGTNFSQLPTVSSPTYGFFELRVTEPASFGFPRTWKPVRGMVELQFSPTHVVPDL